ATSKEILSLLRELPEKDRRTVVMVTHDPQAAAYGDRIVQIRDGLISGVGHRPGALDQPDAGCAALWPNADSREPHAFALPNAELPIPAEALAASRTGNRQRPAV